MQSEIPSSLGTLAAESELPYCARDGGGGGPRRALQTSDGPGKGTAGLSQTLPDQKLKAISANPAIRRFFDPLCCALSLQNLIEYYEILRIRAPQNTSRLRLSQFGGRALKTSDGPGKGTAGLSQTSRRHPIRLKAGPERVPDNALARVPGSVLTPKSA